MSETISIERVEEVPQDATVRHYDEFAGSTKDRLGRLLQGDADPAEIGEEIGDADLVKFTDYYAIERA